MYRDQHWTVQCTVRADHFQTEKEVEQWVRDIGFEEIQNSLGTDRQMITGIHKGDGNMWSRMSLHRVLVYSGQGTLCMVDGSGTFQATS
jgi:hypothetical protein